MIRVVGGTVRGRKLHGPTGLRFRPTTGRVKEYMFSYLGTEVEGARILDLFSGTGSLTVEALSRGANEVVCVEKSWKHIEILNKNVQRCDFQDRVRVVKGDVFRILSRLGERQEVFDIILADPPFKENWRDRIVKTVSESRVLAEQAVLIIEHDSHDPDTGGHGLQMIRQKRFGQSVVSAYTKES